MKKQLAILALVTTLITWLAGCTAAQRQQARSDGKAIVGYGLTTVTDAAKARAKRAIDEAAK